MQEGLHIHLKELESARMTLGKLMKDGNIVSLGMYSTAAVAVMNRMGRTKSLRLCHLALKIWYLVLSRGG